MVVWDDLYCVFPIQSYQGKNLIAKLNATSVEESESIDLTTVVVVRGIVASLYFMTRSQWLLRHNILVN